MRSLTDYELISAAQQLLTLDWSWRWTDLEALTDTLGWKTENNLDIVARFDSGLGPSSGHADGFG